RPAVAGATDVDDVEVMRLDHAVQVHVDEVEAGSRAPVAQEARLDVLDRERLAQERLVHEVDLTDGQVVGRTPVAIDQIELLGRKGLPCHFSHSRHLASVSRRTSESSSALRALSATARESHSPYGDTFRSPAERVTVRRAVSVDLALVESVSRLALFSDLGYSEI